VNHAQKEIDGQIRELLTSQEPVSLGPLKAFTDYLYNQAHRSQIHKGKNPHKKILELVEQWFSCHHKGNLKNR